jgi:hypothetical protein
MLLKDLLLAIHLFYIVLDLSVGVFLKQHRPPLFTYIKNAYQTEPNNVYKCLLIAILSAITMYYLSSHCFNIPLLF